MRANRSKSYIAGLIGSALLCLTLSGCETTPEETEEIAVVETVQEDIAEEEIDEEETEVASAYVCGESTEYSQTEFTCLPAGELRPILNRAAYSGPQHLDVWVPSMRFPLLEGPAFLNSQVYGYKDPSEYDPAQLGRDGQPMGLPDNGYHQCDSRNYSYPWEDTFCEYRGETSKTRTRICPSGYGHRGIDMRANVCGAQRGGQDHPTVVAATSGYITSIKPHYTRVISDDDMVFYYFHMREREHEFNDLIIANNQIRVERGEPLGKVGRIDYSGGPGTTYHLHFEMETVPARPDDDVPHPLTHIPPYMTLLDAYERLQVGTD